MSRLSSRTASRAAGGPYRVMIVDDSAAIRGFFRRALADDPDIEVVASVGNGQAAIDSLTRHRVDVIVLDIEMPVMDGMTAVPKLLDVDPDVRIIMASTLTSANAGISVQALTLGAADYISKPGTNAEIHSSGSFRRELTDKIKALGFARCGVAARPGHMHAETVKRVTPRTAPSLYAAPITLRQAAVPPAEVVAIGSSTGGPQALITVLSDLGADFAVPILITQHMPATFTGILADHVAKAAQRPAAEAQDREPVLRGRIYIAPGDWHMVVEARQPQPIIRLSQDPPENYCRPSVDVLLRSMVQVYRNRLLSVILTGMGHDGLDGARSVAEAGGTVIAQDERTSVVWGMPGAVATAGLCSAVLPIDEIASRIRAYSGRVAA